jgi:hypothetical protein
VVAGAVILGGTLEYLVLDVFLAAPFAVGSLVFLLSLAAPRWPRPVARAVLGLSVLIPIVALVGAIRGDVEIAVPIFDTLLFGWLFSCAWPVARSVGGALRPAE